MKQYLYLFTRQDICPEQQLVQTAHVAYQLGLNTNKKDLDEDIAVNFVCVGVRNLAGLDGVLKILKQFGYDFTVFREPHFNDEMTSIATHPIPEIDRGPLLAFNLLKF